MSNVIKMMGLIIVLLCISLISFFIDFNNYQNINYQNINYTTSRSFDNKKNIDSIIKTERFDELVKKNEFQKIENELKKINSIKNIEIYRNSNLELEIDIIDRDPIAVLLELNSYMDSSGVIIWTNNLVIDSLVQIIGTIDKSKIPKILKLMQFPCSDALSYAHLAEGRVEVVIQCSNKIWDIHPIIPIVKAAGGHLSTWDNRDAVNAGNILVSSNKVIHNKFLKLLKPVAK